MSLKGKKILVGDNGENIKIYKPLRESVKVQKEGITIEYLQNIYSNYFLPLVGKDEKFSDIEVTRKIFKCKFSLFFDFDSGFSDLSFNSLLSFDLKDFFLIFKNIKLIFLEGNLGVELEAR